MWEYSKEVMEHYRNPKNVGKIDNADAIGEAGSLACGDSLKLYLKIKDGIITDAKFQTFGCGSAVASSSVLTELLMGKTIDEARKISNKDIADAIGGLPPEKMHCSVMGHEALEDAISKYLGEDLEFEEEEKLICHCYDVSEKTIKEAILENNLQDVEDVVNFTKAGGGCGRCQGAIREILNEVRPKERLSQTQLILKINNLIENHIAPELQKDGGDVELVDVEGNEVKIKLKGHCSACPNSHLTIKNFVEATLKEHVSSDIKVVEVKS